MGRRFFAVGGLKLTRNQKLKCECGAYWFPHRIKSGLCKHRPDSEALEQLMIKWYGPRKCADDYYPI